MVVIGDAGRHNSQSGTNIGGGSDGWNRYLGFDHNRRKILSALKTSFCLALIIYKITMPVLSFLNLAEQMLIERKNIHSVITQLESEKR